MNIQKVQGKIIKIKDIGQSAREVTIQLSDELDIIPGCFINIFMHIDGEVHRRAYSIASDCKNRSEVKIAVRKKENGLVSPHFWDASIIGTTFDVMGPLGINTLDKLYAKRVFLVGYGIGVSVIKALVHGLQYKNEVEEIYIITGNRDEYDILYREFFDRMAQEDSRVQVRYVVAQTHNDSYPYIGFAQEHISDYDFNDSDVYVCGQEVACNGLIDVVKGQLDGSDSTQFFVEAFH